jgi:hypothetical protein
LYDPNTPYAGLSEISESSAIEKVVNSNVSTCVEFNNEFGSSTSFPSVVSFFLQEVETKSAIKKVAESPKTFRHELG